MEKRQTNLKTWRKVKLGEVAEVISGYAFKSADFTNYGIPIVKIKNIASGFLNLNDIEYYSKEIDGLENYLIKKGDILISMTGSHSSQWSSVVGKIARSNSDMKPLMNQRVGKIKPNLQIIDNNYLYYCLWNDETTLKVANRASGSANQANISPDIIKDLEIFIPEDIKEQKRIADILSAFDDKIELNNKISAALEQMAQAIFKEWFINFRFPGHEKVKMVDSELGKIPKGWEVKNFEDIMDFLNGEYIPQSQYDSKGDYLIYGSNTIMGRSNKYLYKGPIIILAKIGSYCGAIKYSHSPCWINNNAGGIRGKKEIPTSFIYYLLRKFNFNQVKEGTGQPFISMKGLKIQKGILPPQKLLDLFNKNIDSIKNYIAKSEKENQKLAALRDLLLPKLMNGGIRA